MTFREKLEQDYPDRDIKHSIDYMCPYDFGYEECKKCDGECEVCWNREMPEPEPKKLTIQEAINVMQKYTKEPLSKVVIEAHQIAIAALEKQIPKKVIIEPWNPARCPSCNCELSESLGDGYYKHHITKKVCECGQKLDWEDENAE